MQNLNLLAALFIKISKIIIIIKCYSNILLWNWILLLVVYYDPEIREETGKGKAKKKKKKEKQIT